LHTHLLPWKLVGLWQGSLWMIAAIPQASVLRNFSSIQGSLVFATSALVACPCIEGGVRPPYQQE
jgi:hypothetical protein